jgi:HKD family nuclease
MKLQQAISSSRKVWELPKDDIINGALNPAFAASINVNIMAGFYSSGAIRELAYGLSHLIVNPKGKLRIVCSQYLNEQDIPSDDTEKVNSIVDQLFLDKTKAMDAIVSYTRECISYLYRVGKVDIKIAVSRDGLFHKKVYLFEDGEDGLVISGSANFSVGGFKRNHETVIVGRSWDLDHTVRELFETQKASFDRLWDNDEEGVVVYTISEAKVSQIIRYRTDIAPPSVPPELEEEISHDCQDPIQVFKIPEYLEWNTGKYMHQGKAVHCWVPQVHRL